MKCTSLRNEIVFVVFIRHVFFIEKYPLLMLMTIRIERSKLGEDQWKKCEFLRCRNICSKKARRYSLSFTISRSFFSLFHQFHSWTIENIEHIFFASIEWLYQRFQVGMHRYYFQIKEKWEYVIKRRRKKNWKRILSSIWRKKKKKKKTTENWFRFFFISINQIFFSSALSTRGYETEYVIIFILGVFFFLLRLLFVSLEHNCWLLR